jgi:hypothetical protein
MWNPFQNLSCPRETVGMSRHDLPDAHWTIIDPLLPKQRSGPGRKRHDARRTLNGLLCVLKTGCTWEAVPRADGLLAARRPGRRHGWQTTPMTAVHGVNACADGDSSQLVRPLSAASATSRNGGVQSRRAPVLVSAGPASAALGGWTTTGEWSCATNDLWSRTKRSV